MPYPALPGPIVVGAMLDPEPDEALRHALALAQQTQRELVVVHALFDPTPLFAPIGDLERAATALRELRTRSEAALREQLSALGADEARAEIHIGSPASAILKVAEREGAALVVLGATATPTVPAKVEKWLLGSTADQVLRHGQTDVLVVRRTERREGPILVCTDLSEAAQPAIDSAVNLAGTDPLIALHVLDIAHPILSAFEPLLVLDDATRKELHDTCREVLRTSVESAGRNLEADDVVVMEGKPSRVIRDFAHERGATLVVMATHGRTGLERLALGSVAADVTRRAACSVLVVRSRAARS